MVKETPKQRSYASGEWTDDLEGRDDLAGWWNSLRIMKNWIAQVWGSATRRPGTIFILPTKDNGVARLIRFVFSVEQAYQLEFGDEYIRFFTLRGVLLDVGVPYEIASPYTSADIAALKFTQSDDVLYLFNGEFQVRKLIRLGPVDWTLDTIQWIDGPYLDENGIDAFTLTPSGATGNITVTASQALFAATDVGRLIRIGFLSSPWATSTVYAVGDLRFANSNVYRCTIAGTSASSGTGPSGTGVGIPDNTVAWEFVNTGGIGWGYVEITAFTDDQNVDATVLASLVKSGVATSVWRMGLFSDTTGYPVHGVFQGTRLYLGGARISNSNMIAGSRVGDFENHSPSVADDGPILKPVNSDQVNAIQWLAAGKGLIIGTQGAEAVMSPDRQFGAITPTNNDVTIETNEGCAPVQPVPVQKGLLFLQFHIKRIIELVYTFSEDGWESPDMTLRADHITDDGTEDGIVEMARQKQPWNVIWSARKDGLLLGLSYMRKEAVIAWHRHEIGGTNKVGEVGVDFGKVLSVSTIPGQAGDELWMIVERVIDGGVKRYVELLSDPLRKSGDRTQAINVDSAISAHDDVAKDVWTGADHLIGETVKVMADGAAHKDLVVSAGGSVTLDRDANDIVIGYEIDSVMLPQRPEGGSQLGTSSGKQKIVYNMTMGLKQSLGMEFGPSLSKLKDVLSRRIQDDMDAPVPFIQGSVSLIVDGRWSPDSDVYLVNRSVFPSTLTYHVFNMHTGDGK